MLLIKITKQFINKLKEFYKQTSKFCIYSYIYLKYFSLPNNSNNTRESLTEIFEYFVRETSYNKKNNNNDSIFQKA